MKLSNFIFFILGLAFSIIGILIEHNRDIFTDIESVGHLGHALYVLGVFTILFQFLVWGIKILLIIFKELWNEIKNI